ncbi:MAG: aminotransferase class III-fold pyridoxal phosphate-dependent enzyme, partial [Pseudomonadota bacterium]
ESALKTRLAQHPQVGDIRGKGLFWGLELVRDRETKESFDPSERVHTRLKSAAFDEGLICYPMGGTVDGKRGDHVLLAPPFVISDAQIDELVDKLGRAIQSTLV